MIDLFPTKCNICGGEVIYISNSIIYHKEYGSGKMYYCMDCGAYVGTHKPRPKEALGILSNEKMRDMKKKCHSVFDLKWINEKSVKSKKRARTRAYKDLADKLNIPVEECHFGYFDMNMLNRAYLILSNE